MRCAPANVYKVDTRICMKISLSKFERNITEERNIEAILRRRTAETGINFVYNKVNGNVEKRTTAIEAVSIETFVKEAIYSVINISTLFWDIH